MVRFKFLLGFNLWLSIAFFAGCDSSGSKGAQDIDGLQSCGNGNVDNFEECDDGNNEDGDGCSAACVSEISCNEIDRCSGGLACRNNRCVVPDVSFDLCEGVECEANQRCEAGECVEDGSENPCAEVDCEEGQVCEAGQCVGAGVDPCAEVDCEEGQVCEAGQCVGAGVDPCAEVDCEEGQICEEGECILDGPCVEDEDCREGEFCKTGNCLPIPMIDFCLGVVCGDGLVCEEGACVEPPDLCADVNCEAGRACEAGQCIVVDPCADVTCGANQRCEVGACVDVDPCEGVECGANQRCEVGACVDIDPCEGVECGANQRCEAGACVDIDPCEGVQCGGNQRCEAGACVDIDPCEGVECGGNQRCEAGACVDIDPCEGVQCGANQRCEVGACVDVDPCEGVQCGGNQRCEAGACVDIDPCAGVQCGIGQQCAAGECLSLYAGCGDLIAHELRLDGGEILGSTVGRENNFQSVDDGSDACTTVDRSPEELSLFRPNQSGYACISTLGSSFDTYLFVKENSCEGEQVLCGDDITRVFNQYYGTLRMQENTDYIVFVSGSGNRTGDYELSARSGPCSPCDVCDDLGQSCVDGRCVDQCADVECPGGLVCEDGQCVESPDSDGTCEAPFVIELDTAVQGNVDDRASNMDAASCNFNAIGPEAVFAFTPEANGRYCADVSGTAFDSIVSVQSPVCGRLADEQACVDQADSPGQKLAFEAEADETYYLVLNSSEGARGQYQMQVETCECAIDADCGGEFIQCVNNACVPEFRDCTGFEDEIFVDGAAVEGSTFGQVNNFQAVRNTQYLDRDIECFSYATGPEDLVLLRPNQSGFVCLSTEGSDYDTYLHVKENNCNRFSSQVACVDNRRGAVHFQAITTLQVEQDQDYVIFVDSPTLRNSGDYTLTASSGPCAECDVCSASGQVCKEETQTCVECTSEEHCGEDQLCGLDNTCYFPDGCVNSAECGDGLVCLNRRCSPPECVDDLDCASGFICDEGICRDSGFPGCGNPREIDILGFNFGEIYQGDTLGRSRNHNASCGGSGLGPEQVYHFTVDRPRNMCIKTVFADFDQHLYIRQNLCADDSQEVACNDDYSGDRAGFKFLAIPGEDYFLFADGSGFLDNGDYRFSVDRASDFEECGDQFLSAGVECFEGVQDCPSGSPCVEYQCDSGCVDDVDCPADQFCIGGFCRTGEELPGSTCDAPQRIAVNQPVLGDLPEASGLYSRTSCNIDTPGKEVVFEFVPEENGRYCINTSGSDFDTVLSIHRGEGNCGNLNAEIACNDDQPRFASGAGSAIGLNASRGERYYLVIDGAQYYENANYRLMVTEGDCIDNGVPQCDSHEQCKDTFGCVDGACVPYGNVELCQGVTCGDGTFCEAGVCRNNLEASACMGHELSLRTLFRSGRAVEGTTSGKPNLHRGALCGDIETGGEEVFAFGESRRVGPICITAEGSEVTPMLYARIRDCNNSTAELQCEYGEDGQITIYPEPGQRYYIFVDSPVVDGVAQEGNYQLRWYYGECEPAFPREPVNENTCTFVEGGVWQQSGCPDGNVCYRDPFGDEYCFDEKRLPENWISCNVDFDCPRDHYCNPDNRCFPRNLNFHCNDRSFDGCDEGLACYDRDTHIRGSSIEYFGYQSPNVDGNIAPNVNGSESEYNGTHDGLCVDDQNGCLNKNCPIGMECVDSNFCQDEAAECVNDADCTGDANLCESGVCIQYIDLPRPSAQDDAISIASPGNPIEVSIGAAPIKANMSRRSSFRNLHDEVCPSVDLIDTATGQEAYHYFISPHRGQVCVELVASFESQLYVYDYDPEGFLAAESPDAFDVYFDMSRDQKYWVECGNAPGDVGNDFVSYRHPDYVFGEEGNRNLGASLTVNVEHGRHYYIVADVDHREEAEIFGDGDGYSPYYLRVTNGSCEAPSRCNLAGECPSEVRLDLPDLDLPFR